MRRGRAGWKTDVPPSRFAGRDLAREALAGVIQRPGRSMLTMLGTVLGVGAFVAVLGLTATASSQIGNQFSMLRATTVTVTDGSALADSQAGGSGDPPTAFPSDADRRITRLNGVVGAGVWWTVHFSNGVVIGASPGVKAGSEADIGQTAAVYAASPGIFNAIQPTLGHGVLFNTFHDQRGESVCMLGEALARRIGITQLETRPAIFIDGHPFTVVGIIDNTVQLPEILLGIILPRTTAQQLYGPPSAANPAQMLIRTKIGAGSLIAHQAPLALRPDQPGLLSAVAPPDPHSLHDKVGNDLTGLFLLLASICLVIGAVGIANTTFVAVLERTGEIGLRRALGARARHIAVQFLTESTALGLLGGMIGTSIAVAAVLAVSLVQQWTAVLDPITVIPAPFIGALTGLLAGLYPALRAANIEPQEALRR
jgi:putative ABC transport system permease protein